MARHILTSSLVAIKILSKSEIRSKHLSHKVKLEIKILRSFHHPNIIRLYDILESSNSLFIVMEYLAGGELYNVIEQQRLTEDQARMYFIQILSGLEYIHGKGYAHRDIKPENLLLDIEGNVKIGDFGLSNFLTPGEFLKTQCGSPNYAAPEVISGAKYCGTEADVWSLGVVLFALVSRELPFDDPSIPVLFARIKSGNFKMKNQFSKNLKDLISRMLTVDPIERITIQQIKSHDWLRALPGYEKNFEINREIVKLYKNPEVRRNAMKQSLKYKEFKNLGIEAAEKLIKEKQESEEFDQDGDDLSATFNILFDLEMKSRRLELDKERISEKGCLKPEPHPISGKNTAASSFMSNPEGRIMPCNWVYGFRSTLQYGYLSIKLLETFKKLGFFWKMRSKSSLLIKKQAIKIIASLFSFEEVIVVDFTLQQGTVMEFFEVIHSFYKKIYKFTHI